MKWVLKGKEGKFASKEKRKDRYSMWKKRDHKQA